MSVLKKYVNGELVTLSDEEKSAHQSLGLSDEDKKNILRGERESLLAEADIKINTIADAGGNASAWRTYRQALRDITKSDDLDNPTWPTKPS